MKTPDFRKTELAIPTYWSSEEALAVFELIDDLRDKIWARYGLQLQELIKEQQQSHQSDQPQRTQTELPF
jgi:hypothetical protein